MSRYRRAKVIAKAALDANPTPPVACCCIDGWINLGCKLHGLKSYAYTRNTEHCALFDDPTDRCAKPMPERACVVLVLTRKRRK
jgi:hypothetical protein